MCRAAAHRDAPFRTDDGALHLSAPNVYARVLSYLKLEPGLSCLNIGSGSGYLCALIAKIVGAGGAAAHQVGLEVDKRAVDSAKSVCARLGVPTAFVHANAFKLDVEGSGHFDRIYIGAAASVSASVQFARLLRPGGFMVGPIHADDDEQKQAIVRVRRAASGELQREELLGVTFKALVRGSPLSLRSLPMSAKEAAAAKTAKEAQAKAAAEKVAADKAADKAAAAAAAAAVPTPLPVQKQTTAPAQQQQQMRMTDLAAEPLSALGPITGVMKAERLSLLEAAMKTEIEDVDSHAFLASEEGARLAEGDRHGLDADEVGALFLYTMESGLYDELNRLLRMRQREQLKPFFPYMRLLLTARQKIKMPAYAGVVWRGVKGVDLRDKYPPDKEVYWWAFSSTTKKLHTLTNEMFLGTTGVRLHVRDHVWPRHRAVLVLSGGGERGGGAAVPGHQAQGGRRDGHGQRAHPGAHEGGQGAGRADQVMRAWRLCSFLVSCVRL